MTDRAENWWVRVYRESPMDESEAVMIEVGDRDEQGRGQGVVYVDPDEAIRFATAILVAAKQAKHAAVVDGVVATRRAKK